jgi:hypothetical protein
MQWRSFSSVIVSPGHRIVQPTLGATGSPNLHANKAAPSELNTPEKKIASHCWEIV